MKKILLIQVITVLTFFSCKQAAVEQRLSDTDSVMVQFYNEDGIIYNAVTSTEKSAIKKLSSFMDNRSVTATKCGSRGKVQFFADDSLVLDATYSSLDQGCRFFTYEMDGKLYHIAMSNEAADFIQSLREHPAP